MFLIYITVKPYKFYIDEHLEHSLKYYFVLKIYLKKLYYHYSLLRSSSLACRSASASVVPAAPPSATGCLPLAAGANEPTGAPGTAAKLSVSCKPNSSKTCVTPC